MILVTLFLSRCHQPFYIHTFHFLIMKSCINCEKKYIHTSRQISFNHFILSRHSLEFVHRLLSDSLHSLSCSLLNTLSPSLCLGWSASLQLGSYPDIHTDAAIDRQFSNIPHSYRTSHGPWTQPALPHPMGGWEHHRKGEHWCVRRRHTETLCQHIWGGSRTYIFSYKHFINRSFRTTAKKGNVAPLLLISSTRWRCLFSNKMLIFHILYYIIYLY